MKPVSIMASVLWVACMAGMAGARADAEPQAATSAPAAITLAPVAAQPLPDDPGTLLTAVVVNMAPKARTTSHRHGGMVFVYVLEGSVRSQLNGGEIVEYRAGDSWSEPPGTVHSLMENPSGTAPARLLATLITPADAELTTYD